MKRVIAIMLVFSMCFTLFSCKEADEDTAKPLEKLQNENKNEQGEIKQEQSENTEGTPNVNEQESQPEKEEPRYTIEDDFSPYEVIVTLTKQETDLKKEYTEKDFPNADVFYVVQNQDYYGNPNFKDAYPEYQDKTTLFMYLNTPSKQNVLDTIEKLKQDERIFDADVCFLSSKNILSIIISDKYLMQHLKDTIMFDSFNIRNVSYIDYNPIYYNQDNIISIEFKNNTDNVRDVYDAMKILKDDIRFNKILPVYSQYTGNLTISYKNHIKGKKYTANDFPEIAELEIINISVLDFGIEDVLINIYVKNASYAKLIKAQTNLIKSGKYQSVFLDAKSNMSYD